MAPIAGWYDDPRDASRLRYWDGDAWTEHVTARQAQVAAPQWQYPGAQQAQPQTWQYGAPPQQAWPQTAGQVGSGPLTPDGVRITTWIKRFLARLLDGLIVFVGAVPITGYFLYHYWQAISDQLNSGQGTSLIPSSEVLRWEVPLFVILLALQTVYETVCLRWWGATVGKRALEISVRRYEHGGRLDWPTIARRVGFIFGLAALNLLPVLSLLAAVALLLDYLWPLWDKRNQALHDKFSDTVVVEGHRQPAAAPAPQPQL